MNRLSNAGIQLVKSKKYLLFVGSFAPFHDGHIDVITSAEKFLESRICNFGGTIISHS